MSDMLSSWSRRRAAVAAEAEQENRTAQEAALAQEQEALAEKSDEEILETLGLPDPDSLAIGDDFKAFMSKAVPEHIRKRALRKLWRSNPVLACVDGLNDYDDDYLAQSIGQDALKTTYQVGKGMLAHLLEIERQKEAGPAVAKVEVEEDTTEEVAETRAPSVDLPKDGAAVEEDPAPFTPRRMQFQFEDDVA
ncbi:Protein of unknown function [Yoonia rosea]|uniref:DUF3306 domain-containing protein n=2 Tax=Yoonia rosea TaxID=287098 RepID=A0A1R3XD07_9RHOB|nr:Protein of unknown function [Yoonia rosea]